MDLMCYKHFNETYKENKVFGSILNNVVKLTANVVTLPLAIGADIVTVGGVLTDREETYTETKANVILDHAEDIIDEVFENK